MSLPITLLLLFIAIATAVLTLRTFRRLTADSAFWGLLIGFIAAVAAALVVDFHDPNSGVALIYGVITAFVATPVVMVVAFFVRRVLTRRGR
jgi:F0F1-type ATP synthase assembly protein I